MKKTLIFSAMLAALSATPAQADTIFGLYAGVQGWNMQTDGAFANDVSDLTTFSFDDETQTNFYAAVEHPLPMIPNIKLRRTSMDTEGGVTLTEGFDFGDGAFAADTVVLSQVDMVATDYILYYELFDNDLVTFDFGLNGKHLDGDIRVIDQAGTTEGRVSFSQMVPMLYSRVAAGLPFTGWGVEAEGSFLSVSDSTLVDAQAMVTYRVVDNLAADLTVMAGYRTVTIELDDVDDLYTDMEFKGPYAGVEVHF